MGKIIKKCKEHFCKSTLYKHKTKRHVLKRFLFLLFFLIIYFAFISYKYGFSNGLLVTAITWSFFVLCTPIADAGFLLDFPIRLITKIKMIYSEVLVWIIAFSLNIYSYFFNFQIYKTTKLLEIFYVILSNPLPFWSIIIISMIGTFLSVFFGDELLDVAHHYQREKYHKHKEKHHLTILIFIIILTIFLYYYLIKKLNLQF